MWIACAAPKYLDADDNARLVEEASIDEFFVEAGPEECCGLAWCESTDEVPFGVVRISASRCAYAIDASHATSMGLRPLDGVRSATPSTRRPPRVRAQSADAVLYS